VLKLTECTSWFVAVANGLHADFSGFTVRTGTIAGALQE